MRRLIDHIHLEEISRLSRWRRIFHTKTLRHIKAISVGVAIMLIGTRLTHVHAFEFIPHFVVECFTAAIHAAGFTPIAKHVEPLFDIMTAEG